MPPARRKYNKRKPTKRRPVKRKQYKKRMPYKSSRGLATPYAYNVELRQANLTRV